MSAPWQGKHSGSSAAPHRVPEIPLNGEFVVGRGETGSGNLAEDTEISRRHARFRRENGSFVVEDLGSTNGTYVNGRQVTGPTVLTPGDEIKLGRTLVKFDGVTEQTQARPQAVRPQPTAAAAQVPVAAPAAAATPTPRRRACRHAASAGRAEAASCRRPDLEQAGCRRRRWTKSPGPVPRPDRAAHGGRGDLRRVRGRQERRHRRARGREGQLRRGHRQGRSRRVRRLLAVEHRALSEQQRPLGGVQPDGDEGGRHLPVLHGWRRRNAAEDAGHGRRQRPGRREPGPHAPVRREPELRLDRRLQHPEERRPQAGQRIAVPLRRQGAREPRHLGRHAARGQPLARRRPQPRGDSAELHELQDRGRRQADAGARLERAGAAGDGAHGDPGGAPGRRRVRAFRWRADPRLQHRRDRASS